MLYTIDMGEINIFDFGPLVERVGCSVYVETGTGIGVCLKHMLQYPFEKFYSIDLDEKLIEDTRKKITDKRVKFVNDYSSTALKNLVPKLPKDNPVFFFLDAHFPYADFHKMPYEESIREFKEEALPLLNEIKIILDNRDVSKDVFLIDDWKIYDSKHPYQYGGWEYTDIQKEVGIETNGEEILDFLRDTHDFEIKLNHQGFLFAIPKKRIK